MITSKDAEKAYDKIQHPFMIKTCIKVNIDRTHLNIVKAICKRHKPQDNTNDEKLNYFMLNSGTWQECPL